MSGRRPTGADRAEQRFRQMCCLSVRGPLIAPMLFQELQSVVPFASCLCMWLSATGMVDAYFNVPEVGRYLPLYDEVFFRGREAQVWATPDQAAASEYGPRLLEQVLRMSTAAYFRHPVYNEVMLPSNVHTFIRLLVRDQGRPIVTFTISRGPHEQAFDEDDRQVLIRLEPFIAHALSQRRDMTVSEFTQAESALVLVDESARILSLSPAAKALLSMSQGSALAPPVMHEGILQTVHALTRLRRGDASAAAPVWHARNAWGRFSARSYWLEEAGAQPCIGIFLERQVPRELKLLEGLHRTEMPMRQEQVALLLALGNSEHNVANTLGLSHNTVVYHRRQIYNRLEVDSRQQLIARLCDPSAKC